MNFKLNYKILFLRISIIFFINTNLLVSEIEFSNSAFPDTINLNIDNYKSIMSNYLSKSFMGCIESSYKFNEIKSITNIIIKYGIDSILITQISLIESHTMVVADNYYIIKNLKNPSLVYCNADTLIISKNKNVITLLFVSERRGDYSYDIYRYHKIYKVIDEYKRYFWHYDIDKDDHIILNSIFIEEINAKNYLNFKIFNEKTKQLKLLRKKIRF